MNYQYILLAIFFALFIITIIQFRKEPRSLMIGVFAFLSIVSFVGFGLLASELDGPLFSNSGARQFFLALLIILVFLLMFLPVWIIFSLIYYGIKLIKKEGFSLRNLLSLTLGICLLLMPVWIARYRNTFQDHVGYMVALNIILAIFNYLVLVVSSYTFAGFLNFIHFGYQSLDYVVVLGSGLNQDQVTPLLASRIRKGIKVYRKNPGCKLIMSGGQGKDELIPEAEAMRNYALQQGVREEDILVEANSKNTKENLEFSKSLMYPDAKFAIVTNYYHVFRSLLIARELGISCIGYGAKTKFYFSLNAYIRELIGYLYLKRKFHLKMMLLMSVIAIVFQIFTRWGLPM